MKCQVDSVWSLEPDPTLILTQFRVSGRYKTLHVLFAHPSLGQTEWVLYGALGHKRSRLSEVPWLSSACQQLSGKFVKVSNSSWGSRIAPWTVSLVMRKREQTHRAIFTMCLVTSSLKMKTNNGYSESDRDTELLYSKGNGSASGQSFMGFWRVCSISSSTKL